MKKRIIFITAIAIIAMLGVLTAIKMKRTNVKQNSLEKITSKGTFILGLDDSFTPMGFRNENNEIVGFDIDVAKEVCKKLNVELVVQPISWNAKEQELNYGNIDCIWNGMSITEERKQAMLLSDSYMKNRMVFIAKKDSNLKTLEDLKNKKVGVQSGSSAEQILEESKIYKTLNQTVAYADNITAFMDLETNQIDTVFVDEVLANYYIATNNKNYSQIEQALEEQYAIGFRKEDNELCNKVNEILKEIKRDGTLEIISKKWFGKDVTTIKGE